MAEKEKSRKGWFSGLKAEFKKISWLSREDLTKQTAAVVIVSVILGALITLIDVLVQSGIQLLVN